MKAILYIIFISYSVVCSCQSNRTINNCEENSTFKLNFFKYINNIEAYTLKKKNQDSIMVKLDLFKKSLDEISKYTNVDYSLLTNYEFRYTSEENFLQEKAKWLNWYQENKCSNLQWVEQNKP